MRFSGGGAALWAASLKAPTREFGSIGSSHHFCLQKFRESSSAMSAGVSDNSYLPPESARSSCALFRLCSRPSAGRWRAERRGLPLALWVGWGGLEASEGLIWPLCAAQGADG